jgi:hypothetical protein
MKKKSDFPTFNAENYPKEVNELFEFLIADYGYKLTTNQWKSITYVVIYENKNKNKKIDLNFDIRDNAFYFYLYENDKRKIFLELLPKYEKISPKKLIPDNDQYIDALKLNAQLLKKHGEKILK